MGNIIDTNVININESINYNNQDEVTKMDNHLKHLLSTHETLPSKQIKWLVRYLLNKEAHELGLKTEIKTTNFIENVNQSLKLKSFTLICKNILKSLIIRAYFEGKETQGIITFNTDFYYFDTITKSPYYSLFGIPFCCYHEMKHAIQNEEKNKKNINNEPISLKDYLLYREKYLISQTEKNKDSFYFKNHDKFLIEAEANGYAADKTILFLENYASKTTPTVMDNLKDRKNEALNTQTMYDMNLFNKGLEVSIKKNGLLEENKLLLLEFNNDGSRKNLYEVVKINQGEFNITDDVHYSLICNALVGMDELNFNSYISKMNNEDINKINKALTYKHNILLQRRNQNTNSLNNKAINNKQWLKNDCQICNELTSLLNFNSYINIYIKNNVNNQNEVLALDGDLANSKTK